MNKCKQCDTILESNNKIYCSKYCREKYWRLNNKKHVSEYQRQYRLNTPLLCKVCKKEIPREIRKSGLVFCSEHCRIQSEKVNTKIRRKNISILYGKYKKERGCQICGYNKNQACLDFHHNDGNEKERRITAGLWYYSKQLFNEELNKCRLLCKNCHYDIHHPEISEDL